MRFFSKALASVVCGIALGLLATWLVVGKGLGMDGEVKNGAWRTSLLTGSAASGPYRRAAVALHGLLALGRGETIYYTAYGDDDGETLDGRCVYRIEGRDPDARWWSITAYGADDYLIANPAELYSVSRRTVLRHEDGSFAVTVKRGANAADQIAAGEGAFSLTLRLYNPGRSLAADPAHVALPAIRKVSCA